MKQFELLEQEAQVDELAIKYYEKYGEEPNPNSTERQQEFNYPEALSDTLIGDQQEEHNQ